MLTLRLALFCTTLAAALPAGAQMYKWVDERGQVTYSNTPPPDAAQKKIESVADRVSVYSPDPEINRAMAGDSRRDAKISGLERELEAERKARRAPAPSQDKDARRAAAYARCVADRGVDCDAIRTGSGGDTVYGSTGYFGPQYILGTRNFPPGQPFYVDPTPAPRVGVSTAPPVGISTTPPVGLSTAPPVGAPPRQRAVGSFR